MSNGKAPAYRACHEIMMPKEKASDRTANLGHFGLASPADADGRSLIDTGDLAISTSPLYFGEPKPSGPSAEPEIDPELEKNLRILGYIE